MTCEELARTAYDAWSRCDIGAFLAVIHPDFVCRPTRGATIGGSVCRGHQGVRDWFADVHQEGELFETRMTAMEERGTHGLLTFAVHARGRASGIVVDGELGHVTQVRDGLVLRIDGFQDREAAVAAFESA